MSSETPESARGDSCGLILQKQTRRQHRGLICLWSWGLSLVYPAADLYSPNVTKSPKKKLKFGCLNCAPRLTRASVLQEELKKAVL